MDGKHIVIKQSKNSGSYYFNYKGTFSVVLLALVVAIYKFIFVDVGCNGRISDGGVYRNSSLSKAIENCLLGIPPDRMTAEGMEALPHAILIDDAFPLTINLMKPYPLRNLIQSVFTFFAISHPLICFTILSPKMTAVFFNLWFLFSCI